MVAPPLAQPAAPPPPGPQAPGGPPPASGSPVGDLPPALMPAVAQAAARIAQLAGVPPQRVLAVLVAYLRGKPPQAVGQFLGLPAEEQGQALANFLAQRRAQAGPVPPQGGVGVPGGGPQAGMPPPQGPPPGMGPPVGAPPNNGVLAPIPQPGAPSPLPGGTAGPPGTAGQPAKPAKPPRQKKQRKPAKFSLGALPESKYGKAGPDLATVVQDAQYARKRDQHRDQALQEVYDLYHLLQRPVKADGEVADPLSGEIVYTTSLPATVVNRTIARCAPSLDRVKVRVEALSEDEDVADSAQAIENACRTFWEEHVRRWFAEQAEGNGASGTRPPLERFISGLATVEGTIAFQTGLDPSQPEFPFVFEPLNAIEVYQLPHATLRVYETTAGRARNLYPKQLGKALPTGEDGPAGWDDTATVTLTCWTDDVWWCIACHGLPRLDGDRPKDGGDRAWLQEPVEHGLGYRLLQYPPPWLGTPVGPTNQKGTAWAGRWVSGAIGRDLHPRYATRGVLHAYVPMYRLFNQVMGAVATGAFKGVNPPLQIEEPPGLDAEVDWQGVGDQLNQAGGLAVTPAGTKVTAILHDLAATPSGRPLLQLLVSEQAAFAPPVLGGGGDAASGLDRITAQDAASQQDVEPIQHFICDVLALLFELHLRAFLRQARSKKPWLKAVQFRRAGASDDGKTTRYAFLLEAADVERQGVRVTVKMDSRPVVEKLQLMQLMLPAIKEHLHSRLYAQDEIGIDDTERERVRMLLEAVWTDPDFVKAEALTALGEVAPTQAAMLHYVMGQQQGRGSAPRDGGTASMPSRPPMPAAAGSPATAVPSALNPTGV